MGIERQPGTPRYFQGCFRTQGGHPDAARVLTPRGIQGLIWTCTGILGHPGARRDTSGQPGTWENKWAPRVRERHCDPSGGGLQDAPRHATRGTEGHSWTTEGASA
eukprot:9494035-Pyramimonas_sp.AAC.1